MSAVAIVPARLASSRFPEKVLASQTGRPLIQHVAEAAARARSVARVVVAADSQRVVEAVAAHGTEAVLTSAAHPNGTSRLAEACEILGLGADAVVVNVQGDEPELEPGVIDACVDALVASGAPIATAATPIRTREEFLNPNVVKVVTALDGTAMLFSRAPIPHDRDAEIGGRGNRGSGGGDGEAWAAAREPRPLRHIGLYVYRRSFLDTFLRLPETPLERCEKLEQLRALQHGHRIAVTVVEHGGFQGVDTPEQYAAFVRRWRERGGSAG